MVLWSPTPNRWWPHPIAHVPKKWHTERWSEASLWTNGLLFLLCGCLHNEESIKTACQHGQETGLLNRRIQHADLELDNFGASLTGLLLFCIHYSSRLSLFCSNLWQDRHYFCGRQRSICVHMFTRIPIRIDISHNDIINSILVHFFVVYIFAEAVLSTKICTQWKYPAIQYNVSRLIGACQMRLVLYVEGCGLNL